MSTEYTINARRPDGSVDITKLATIVHATETDVAESIGLAETSAARSQENGSSEEQQRLVKLVELLEHVAAWAGDPRTAYQWFCHQPIAGFGGRTAQQLVKAGRVSAVEAYLKRIADGGYA